MDYDGEEGRENGATGPVYTYSPMNITHIIFPFFIVAEVTIERAQQRIKE